MREWATWSIAVTLRSKPGKSEPHFRAVAREVPRRAIRGRAASPARPRALVRFLVVLAAAFALAPAAAASQPLGDLNVSDVSLEQAVFTSLRPGTWRVTEERRMSSG